MMCGFIQHSHQETSANFALLTFLRRVSVCVSVSTLIFNFIPDWSQHGLFSSLFLSVGMGRYTQILLVPDLHFDLRFPQSDI